MGRAGTWMKKEFGCVLNKYQRTLREVHKRFANVQKWKRIEGGVHVGGKEGTGLKENSDVVCACTASSPRL